MKPRKYTILIVEDEKPLRQILAETFREEKFNVILASDGNEGLVRAQTYHPDVILVDIIMPKMNGLEMLTKLRVDKEWGKTVPVVLLTNLNTHDDKMNAVARYEPYLIKSELTLQDVVQKVCDALERRPKKKRSSTKTVQSLGSRSQKK